MREGVLHSSTQALALLAMEQKFYPAFPLFLRKLKMFLSHVVFGAKVIALHYVAS